MKRLIFAALTFAASTSGAFAAEAPSVIVRNSAVEAKKDHAEAGEPAGRQSISGNRCRTDLPLCADLPPISNLLNRWPRPADLGKTHEHEEEK